MADTITEMVGIIYGRNSDTYLTVEDNITSGSFEVTSGSFENDLRTQSIDKTGTVHNFFEVKEGKIIGGCMDLKGGLYTVVPFERRFVWCVDGEGVKHYKDLGVQYYREGTLVFRRSGAYHQSKKVISITTTDNSIKITTNQGNFLFTDVTSFIRKIKQGEEAIFENKIGEKMTHWTQEERDSLEIN